MRLFEKMETHYARYFEKSQFQSWIFWANVFLFLSALGYGLTVLVRHWNALPGEPRLRWVLALFFAVFPMMFSVKVHGLMRRLLLKAQPADKKLLAGISSSFTMITMSAYVALFMFFSLLLKLWH